MRRGGRRRSLGRLVRRMGLFLEVGAGCGLRFCRVLLLRSLIGDLGGDGLNRFLSVVEPWPRTLLH